MKYTVILTEESIKELSEIESIFRAKVRTDYEVIEKFGTEAININSLGNKLYEIKTDSIRSLFKYQKGQIIVVSLIYQKKTQKTPKKYIDLAIKRLKEYD